MVGVACRRKSIRSSSRGLRVKVLNDANITLDDLAVSDVSKSGCSIATNGLCDLNPLDQVQLSFHSTNHSKNSSPVSFVEARIAYVIKDNNGKRIGLVFNSELNTESLGGYNFSFVNPVNDIETKNSLFENQIPIAKNDLHALRRDVLHLKGCQFQLILGALPLFAAQGATIMPMLSSLTDKGVESMPEWAMLVPIVCAFLSYMMLIVFLQKTGSIRRNLAFVLILQRHMVRGGFPSCYRGWQDAYENYNHILRNGGKINYLDNSRIKQFNIIPTDAFAWLGVAVLGVIPIFSIIIFWIVIYLSKVGPGAYTAIVGGSTAIGVISYLYVFSKINALLRGDQSFRNTILLFSKILESSAPFEREGRADNSD